MQLGIPDSQPRRRDVGSWNVRLNSPMLVTGLVVFVGYYLGAKIGFALTFQPHPVSVLWPANSILVAALLLTPPRIWWFILLAAFPAHWAAQLQSHVPPLMILCWFISNSCEAVISAGLTRYLVGGPIRFRSLREAGIFCLCAVPRRSVFVLVFGRGVCDMESLGPGRLLEADPNTISFERPGGINSCAVDRHVGEERNSSPAESSTFELPGGMRSLSYSVLGQLRCSL